MGGMAPPGNLPGLSSGLAQVLGGAWPSLKTAPTQGQPARQGLCELGLNESGQASGRLFQTLEHWILQV